MRRIAAFFVLTTLLTIVIGIFWHQEMQYLLPTPVPNDYRVVEPNEVIAYDSVLLPQREAKPKLLHFFNPDCPCSRFNVKHFATLAQQYGQEVDFFVVVTGNHKVARAKKLISNGVTIIVDKDETLAKACGVYSTPQAAVIQAGNQLYFRGNYNRSRYCTNAQSNFVQMSLDSMLNHRPAPVFGEIATLSYGCEIGETDDEG